MTDDVQLANCFCNLEVVGGVMWQISKAFGCL